MKPRIRFKGFTDLPDRQAGAWEQRKLGELGKAQSGIGFPDKEQGGKKGIPFFKVSDMNNLGNELEMHIANNYVSLEQIKKNGWSPIEETSVIFAKVGAAIMLNRKRLVRFPFLLDNNTMAYKFNDAWEIDFGRTLFERIDLTSLVQVGALPSYNAGDVENMEVAIPQKAEQAKLGALFTSLDNLITLHQRKYEKFVNIKKALLEKMFPQGDEKVPRIRFKGFTDLPAGRQVLGKWCVYVLACDDGSFYKGITNDLTGRISAHIKGRGAEHTKKHKPIKLVYCEAFETEKEAAAKERFLKSGSGREWLKQNLQTYKPFDDSRELSYDNDAWEQRKARDLFDSYADKGYPELPVLSATQDAGMVKRDEIGKSVFHDKSNEVGYKRVLPGQFVIHLRSFQGGFAHSNIEGITSPAYTIFGFKPTEKQYDIFWKYIFSSEEFVRRLETVTYGIRDGRSISYDEFLTMGFIVPSYAEQVKIAHGLIITDNLITLHQRQVEKLKNIKSALLEKMFV